MKIELKKSKLELPQQITLIIMLSAKFDRQLMQILVIAYSYLFLMRNDDVITE